MLVGRHLVPQALVRLASQVHLPQHHWRMPLRQIRCTLVFVAATEPSLVSVDLVARVASGLIDILEEESNASEKDAHQNVENE